MVNNSATGAAEKSKQLAPIIRGWRNYHKHCNMENYRLWHVNYRTWKRFKKQPSFNRHDVTKLIEKAFPPVSWSKHKFVNVRGNKSPYDGDLVYWSKRNSKLYSGPTAKTLKRQQFKCVHCNQAFIDNQPVELHHMDGNPNNWKPANLAALHQSCHDLIHHSPLHGKTKETFNATPHAKPL